MKKKKNKKFIFNPIYDKLIEEIKNKLKKIKSKKIKNKKYSYIGEIKNNLPNGWGKMVCIAPNGQEDETKMGEFKNGKLNGKGYIKFKHDLEYVGYFNKDQHYKGRALWGSRTNKKDKYYFGYEREFEKDKSEGYAVKFSIDALNESKPPNVVYEGIVNEEIEPQGKGTAYLFRNCICEGNWRWKFAHGECKVQYDDEYYEGIWKYGKLEQLTLEGTWKDKKFIILKDAKTIDKKYIPSLFVNRIGILWILKSDHSIDHSSYAKAKEVFNNYESGEW